MGGKQKSLGHGGLVDISLSLIVVQAQSTING